MLKTFVCLAASLFCVNSFAVELYCAGQKQRDPSQRGVKVDCSDRSEVIGHLGGAWRVLRENSIGGTMEDMCWKPYKKAKEIHPAVDSTGWAPAMFAQCNVALRYIK